MDTKIHLAVSSSTEGLIGGLIFSFFIATHVKQIRTILASLVAIVVGLFGGALIGLSIYDGCQIPFLISGMLVGGLFGLIIGAKKYVLHFAVIGALVFVLGKIILLYVDALFYHFFTDFAWDQGHMVVTVALNALFHGIALGLGTGIYLKRSRHKQE
ncbi:hypothetical protein [Bacillus benzoevorans]|uniref:Uncharacterized protein n=1 Tax=Bacillus benzoevorans TaxID=1456 RepID=A0A7X0LVP1_9BACI|nr:hypothetical protein [Bacillus benzoevorans]MBB6444479.1 hypothetical protein [Bacillus benzoevorans]